MFQIRTLFSEKKFFLIVFMIVLFRELKIGLSKKKRKSYNLIDLSDVRIKRTLNNPYAGCNVNDINQRY